MHMSVHRVWVSGLRGVGVWSEGVDVWSEGVGVWSEGVSDLRGWDGCLACRECLV